MAEEKPLAGDPGPEDSAFEDLQREFEEVMAQLDADPATAAFKDEYEKLHQALVKSHGSEKRLMSKCRELNAELVANAAKVESVLSSGADSEQLQKEVDEAWKLVDQGRDTEAALKEEIERLQEEVDELNVRVEEAESQPQSNPDDIADLMAAKRSLQKERDDLLEQVGELRTNLSDITAKQMQTERAREENEKEVESLRLQLDKKNSEADKEARKKANLERELLSKKEALGTAQDAVQERQATLEMLQQTYAGLQEKYAARNNKIAEAKSEAAAAEIKSQRLARQVDDLTLSNKNASEDIVTLKEELGTRKQEVQVLKKEAGKLEKANAVITKKLRDGETKLNEMVTKRDGLKTEVAGLERDLETQRKEVATQRKQIETLARSRDMLTKQMTQALSDTEVQQQLVVQHEQQQRQLEGEITSFKLESQKQNKALSGLEKERDKHIAEAASHQQKAAETSAELGVAETQILQLKKAVAEGEAAMKQQMSAYEAVRSDRNLTAKNLIAAQDEIAEMKRKLKILNHQIDQLKEEISGKESHLLKEQGLKEEVEGQKFKLKAQVDKLAQANAKTLRDVELAKNEEEKLTKIVGEAEAEKARLKADLERVISERDVLGTQVIRRNDELALVHEKLKIQQNALYHGESAYQERHEDMRVLKVEIKKQRREIANLKKKTTNTKRLADDLTVAKEKLLQEQNRCKALEKEMETPMNVHRWRQLEGSDPGAYEMIQKVQTLQKRLIQKTEEVVEKELRIQEKEKRYMELKNILARQPGPEVAEQLTIYQQTVKDKNRQLKAMASELNMYQMQVSEYQFEIERLARELGETKKKFLSQKRKEALARERERAMQPPVGAMGMGMGSSLNTTQGARTAGGGFNFAQAQPQSQQQQQHQLQPPQ